MILLTGFSLWACDLYLDHVAAVLGLSEGDGGGLGLQLLPRARGHDPLPRRPGQLEVWSEDRDSYPLEIDAGSESLSSVGGHWYPNQLRSILKLTDQKLLRKISNNFTCSWQLVTLSWRLEDQERISWAQDLHSAVGLMILNLSRTLPMFLIEVFWK